MIETDVCIVGAGPTGLTLALELATRGHRVTILESRRGDQFSNPKASHISARSMEIFRRLGMADDVRKQGLPDDFPNDGVYATRYNGFEIARFAMPSRRQRFDDEGYVDDNLPSRERAARVSQMFLAPVMADHARRFPGIQVLEGTCFESLDEDETGVTVSAVATERNEALRVRCRYLVGADGPASSVRKALGVRLEGMDNLVQCRSIMFRAPQLLHLSAYPTAWMHWFFVRGNWSSLIAIDGRELWLIHHFVPPGVNPESVNVDEATREVLGVGDDFSYDVVSREDWTGRRLIAEHFQRGRCFMVGDAIHQWVPYGGYGMNAGIADADNLGWKLDAVLKGWAPPELLDTYELERRPVDVCMSEIIAELSRTLNDDVDPALLEQDSAEGVAARRAFGEKIFADNIHSMVPTGFNFGYCYENSAIVAADGEQAPPLTMGQYTATTVPGCRLPHFWLADGRSLYDALPDGYTLLRFGGDIDVAPLEGAARAKGVPMSVLDVVPGRDFDTAVYRQRLILVRPDQHIAWRGDRIPANCDALIERIRGATSRLH
ncbi:MAG: FAD-dependent oxidoreductase [Porticoccaceae bacterium]